MTTLVTGASGHIGANLVRALLARGRRVRALCHRDHRGIDGLNIEIVHGDIEDPHSLQAAFQDADVVYHLAGRVSLTTHDRALVRRINVNGVANVIEACRAAGVRRLVHFSSIHALVQEPLNTPVDEQRQLVDEHSGGLPYHRSKAAGERLVRAAIEHGLNAIIINPTGIIGPWDFKPSHFGQALLSLANHSLPALIDNGFNWVDARDVVTAAIIAEEQAPSGRRYILSGHWASMVELAKMVEALTGSAPPRITLPMWLARVAAPVLHGYQHLTGRHTPFTTGSIKAMAANRHVSHELATRELDYRPRPLPETIADTMRWFYDHGFPVKLLGRNRPGNL
jgi:dihydroflavonol-4-reductase